MPEPGFKSPIALPKLDSLWLAQCYVQQNHTALSDYFIQGILYFRDNTYLQIDRLFQHQVNLFIESFLHFFVQADYVLNDEQGLRFIQLNSVISNLVAISSFKNTDTHLAILNGQPHNFLKLLVLYSARNHYPIHRKVLFDANPACASLWYYHFFDLYLSGLSSEVAYHNLREHLAFVDERLLLGPILQNAYFGATYINGEQEQRIKQRINQLLQQTLVQGSPQISPQPNKIAIVTGFWYPQHSVYRILSQFVEALSPAYELTLIHLGKPHGELDTRLFQTVISIQLENQPIPVEFLQTQRFQVAFYPDIGMTPESIWLANLRIAPIQLTGYGHPVSTFGAKIDYFIGGAAVEQIADAEANYSERLVLLPGLGAIHNKPSYVPQYLPQMREQIIINCPCYSQKITYPFLLNLKQIAQRSQYPLKFRFFPGAGLLQANHFLPFSQNLQLVLSEATVEIVPNLPYQDYMAELEKGDLCLDTYPFGGSNVIVDCLYLRKPIIAYEGRKWYNRIGSQLLRLAGLSELVATDDQSYVNLALRLIEDHHYREQIQQKLQQSDLETTIFNSEEKFDFKRAIDFLILNHQQLKQEGSRQPIFIV